MDTNELFQKVVDTVQVAGGNGGILNPDQTNRFIDYMWDETVLGQTTRQIRMNAPVREIDKMDLGRRIARHATEGVDDSVNATPTFSKITITTEKIRLDWELTRESLEDNIEQGGLEDHIARLMATQLGNDLEDLAINGDVDIEPGDDGYALLKTFDGYHKRATDGGRVVDHGGAPVDASVFSRAYRALPRKFIRNRNQLRFTSSTSFVHDYYEYLRNQPEGDRIGFLERGRGYEIGGEGGATGISPFGIPLAEIPLQEEDWDTDTGNEDTEGTTYLELTHPDNRIWGIKREVEVYREFKPKKDAIEYTVYTRQGVQIDNLDAYVTVENIGLAEV